MDSMMSFRVSNARSALFTESLLLTYQLQSLPRRTTCRIYSEGIFLFALRDF